MWRLTLLGIRARWRRLGLTAFAVVLGVSFVAGTFVLTDSLAQVVDDELSTVTGGDVVVRSSSGLEGTGVGGRPRFPSSVVEQVARAPGVAAAEGVVLGTAQIVDPEGESVDEPIPLGMTWTDDAALSPLELEDGREPRGDGEVAIDLATARRHDVAVGDTVQILFLGPARDFEVVGLAGFAGGDGRALSSVAGFAPATAQEVFAAVGEVDLVAVATEPGVEPDQAARDLTADLPPGLEAVTADALGEEASATLRQTLGFVEVLLLVFAGVGIVVGAFVIRNTFATLVVQRTRELALVRALGATAAQLRRSVLLEAAVVGLVASVIGLAVGLWLSVGLERILEIVGLDVPRGDLSLQPRTVVVGLAIGVLVSLVSAAWPARRAARVAPVEAMRAGVDDDARSLRTRAIGAGAIAAAGLVLVLVGLADVSLLAPLSGAVGGLDDPRYVVPIGAGVLVVGVVALGPVLAAPVSAALGVPLRRLGVAGRLAGESAHRHPRRTAATAAALLIGVALVTFVSLLASSANASVASAIRSGVKADWVLRGPQFAGMGSEVVPTVAELPEVEAAMGIRLGFVGLGDTTQAVYSIDPDVVDDVLDVELRSGSIDAVADGGVLLHRQEAEDLGVDAGDEVLVEFPQGGVQPVRIAGVFDRNGFTGNFVANLLVGDESYQQRFGAELDSFAFVRGAPGVEEDQVRAALETALVEFPNVEIDTRDEFIATERDQVNRVLAVFYLLLALAVVIAAFGILNTLLLSVVERTREIGLLRTVGMSRAQVARMVGWESLLVALVGAVAGVVLGFFCSWAVVASLVEDGITVFSVRWWALLVFVASAAAVGVVAGLVPARRAARLDVLAAVAEE